jgi:hypothetical protein
MKYKVLALIVFLFLPGAAAFLRAEPLPEEEQKRVFIIRNGNLKIKEIRIMGLTKTSKSMVMRRIDAIPGEPISSFDPERIIQSLRETRLFQEIQVKYYSEGDRAVVEILLKEKWTLIPIPFVNSNEGGTSAGLFVYESNLFGLNKKLYAGGIYSDSGWNGHFGYMDPELAGTDFQGALSFGYASKQFENVDEEGVLYRKYDADSVYTSWRLGYRFNENWIPALEGKYRKVEVLEETGFNRPEGLESYGQGLRLEYKDLYYRSFSHSGLQWALEYFYGPSFSGSKEWYQAKFRGQWTFSFLKDHLLGFTATGSHGDMPAVIQDRIGGRYGFKTLPAERVVAETYASGAFSAEFSLLHFRWGTFTGLMFYEAGVYEEPGREWNFFSGPGSGFRIYLKSVAFPAVGFDVAWNIQTRDFQGSVAIGFSR